MKKKVIKKIKNLIDEHYLTDWEFIVEVIAPEIEEDDLDIEETCRMVDIENKIRNVKLWIE